MDAYARPMFGPLWKHHQRHASAQLPFGKLHSAARGRRRGVVDHDMPSDLTRIPYQRYLLKRLLHHPTKLVVEIAVD